MTGLLCRFRRLFPTPPGRTVRIIPIAPSPGVSVPGSDARAVQSRTEVAVLVDRARSAFKSANGRNNLAIDIEPDLPLVLVGLSVPYCEPSGGRSRYDDSSLVDYGGIELHHPRAVSITVRREPVHGLQPG